ncbi:VC0807 family protein [Streptomyces sp. I05A-00742]|uniref:VC0807 family protein n=1 Tax=Streptomyces sp. I05A-00742 TaxID=2732853 RepID=UPI002016C08A|nr:VC0807 family protein [Streptomyces sp. I05A-00742]
MSQATAAPATTTEQARQGNPLVTALKPLLLDVALPLGSYYLLRDGLGLSLVLSLALSSVVPAARTLIPAVRERTFNGLAGVMLVVNLLSLALSFATGDARLMMAKDSAISSVVGLSILWSVLAGRPLMTAGLKPMLVKGSTAKAAAWERLSAGNARFRRYELTFSVIWGTALLTECAARVVGAYTLPLETMASWGSTAMLLGAIALGVVLGGAVATGPMDKMLDEETTAA